MEERRRFDRVSTSVRVEIIHPSIGRILGRTHDISDGGAQVVIDGQAVPPVGTVVDVMFKKIVGPVNAEPVRMQVVHSRRNVIGLMFVTS